MPPEYVVIVGGGESVIVFDLHALVKVIVNSSYTYLIGIAGSPSLGWYWTTYRRLKFFVPVPVSVANLVLSEHSSVKARVDGYIYFTQEASFLSEKNFASISESGKLNQLLF